jgi:hypothetical protein
MKNIIAIITLLLTSCSLFAQQKEHNEVIQSKWTDKINGKSYAMEALATAYRDIEPEKINLTFSIIGDKTHLTKISLRKNKEQSMDLTIGEALQRIALTAGHYTFQFHHKEMGDKVFELDLKNGDDKKVVLTIK